MLIVIGFWTFLLCLVVFLALAAANGLRPNLALLVARDVTLVVGSVGLLVAIVMMALDKPVLWVVAVMVVATLAWMTPLVVRDWRKRARIG